MAIVWPAQLPSAPRLGVRGEFDPLTIRTPVDHGPAEVRREYSAAAEKFKCPYMLSDTQLGVLVGFYVTTTLGGTVEFEWIHPRTGLTTTKARFVRAPSYTAADVSPKFSTYWEVECEIEVLP